MASPVSSCEIKDGDSGALVIPAGENTKITCFIHGGRPAPLLSLTVEGLDASEFDVIATPDENGVYESEMWVTVTAAPEDHGRKIKCSAAVMDNDLEQKSLIYEMVEAPETELNVTFKPIEMAAQKGEAQEGENIQISFVFMANPEPMEVKWKVITKGEDAAPEPEETDGNNSNDVEGRQEGENEEGTDDGEETNDIVDDVEDDKVDIFGLGHNDDKYKASDLITEAPLKYRANFTLMNVDFEDGKKSYQLEVTNAIGTRTYDFNIVVSEKPSSGGGGGDGNDGNSGNVSEPNTTEEGGEEDGDEGGSSSTGIVFGVLAALCVVAIILGSIFVYMKKRSSSATAPLSAMEGRR